MSKNEKDVTLIARGQNLQILQSGLAHIDSTRLGSFCVQIRAVDQSAYNESPDVVFVCLKTYSLGEITSFLRDVCGKSTVVIPILNGFGVGDYLTEELPSATVLNGCMYIFAERSKPGHFVQRGPLFQILFGSGDAQKSLPVLDLIQRDLEESGIDAVHSANIQKEIFQKMSYVSPMAGVGAYYNYNAGEIREDPQALSFYLDLVREIELIANALDIEFEQDLTDKNLEMLHKAVPESTTSMQRDLAHGGPAEVDSLLFEPVRMAVRLGVNAPNYMRLATHFGYRD